MVLIIVEKENRYFRINLDQMKKIVLITLLAIVSSFIVSCRRELTLEEKAENTVKNYLYERYGANVEIFEFKNFSTMKAYAEQFGKEDYERWVKKHPEDSVGIKKDSESEVANILFGHKNWYKILCVYKAYNWSKIGENFYIAPDFKKVEKQMLITMIQKQDRFNHPYVTACHAISEP